FRRRVNHHSLPRRQIGHFCRSSFFAFSIAKNVNSRGRQFHVHSFSICRFYRYGVRSHLIDHSGYMDFVPVRVRRHSERQRQKYHRHPNSHFPLPPFLSIASGLNLFPNDDDAPSSPWVVACPPSKNHLPAVLPHDLPVLSDCTSPFPSALPPLA